MSLLGVSLLLPEVSLCMFYRWLQAWGPLSPELDPADHAWLLEWLRHDEASHPVVSVKINGMMQDPHPSTRAFASSIYAWIHTHKDLDSLAARILPPPHHETVLM